MTFLLTFVLPFVVSAVLGFIFSKKQYSKRIGSILLQLKMPVDQVEKIVYIFESYNKINREARKETKEAFKKSMVSDSIEKLNKGGNQNG